jgi:ribonuclease E
LASPESRAVAEQVASGAAPPSRSSTVPATTPPGLKAPRRERGRERNGQPLGRYLMCVHVGGDATQIAVLEGRTLVEHFVARPEDEENVIDGNIYRGKVKNVLPGMEAAFVDIGTPKNAVLYWGDVQADRDDSLDGVSRDPEARRIEHLLRPGQSIVCQVTKNPIGLKGARLTGEVSIPGRFVVLVPNSDAYGISKRLDDAERKRLRRILDELRPTGHGLIVRTAAEGAAAEDLRRDVEKLLARWAEIDAKTATVAAPALLYSEPHLAVRVIREELTEEHRGVLIDDRELYEIVRSYVGEIDPALAGRVEYYDEESEQLPLFERHHIHEQLHKALDRKVWLPSGGSLIIERTEALTVIDVNTGKNVGSSSLEETVFVNNLEAAEEIAHQLRLRDIGGIIVVDFIDMEVRSNRQDVIAAFRAALARDKTPTQVFDISELGLVEMTRKRIGEGLVETLSEVCPMCSGRGIVFPAPRDSSLGRR